MANHTATSWAYAAVNAEHAANGQAFHPEALAFRGASLADMLAAAARNVVVMVDDAPVSTVAPTVAPRRAA